MPTAAIAHPPIVSRQQWLEARKALLAKEKELTRAHDALSAQRRRMPMVRIDKPYVFQGPAGEATLLDLFDGRPQLIVYHFMFDPNDPPPGKSGAPWAEGCPGCSHVADNFPHLAHLHARGTTLAMVSRAPLAKIAPFKARMGWTVPWYSSFGSDFNYDFHVTIDPAAGSVEWNYQTAVPPEGASDAPHTPMELPGLSVFLRVEGEVFHTYSTYARGLEAGLTTLRLLDLTPYGRQEAWEDSPAGWPKSPTHSWLRHHDKYDFVSPKRSESCCQGAQARA